MLNRPIVEFAPMYGCIDLLVPEYKTAGAAGMDICAYGSTYIEPWCQKEIRTGWKIKVPEGYECQVRSRSGLALKESLIVFNSPGTIDSDYTGEVIVILYNASDDYAFIEDNQRIAQLVIAPVSQALVVVKDFITAVTKRGSKGFGSTGK